MSLTSDLLQSRAETSGLQLAGSSDNRRKFRADRVCRYSISYLGSAQCFQQASEIHSLGTRIPADLEYLASKAFQACQIRRAPAILNLS